MRRRPAFLAALAVLCTVAIAHLPGNAGDDSPSEKLTVVVYPVSDLPVWKYASAIKTTRDADGHIQPAQVRPDGETEFDPSLLITLIKSSVDPRSWDEAGSIAPHEKTAALVIRATRSNHENVAALLQRLRTKPANEERKNLSLMNEFKIQKMRALNAVFLSERQRSTDRKLAVSTLKEAIERVDESPLDEDQKRALQERLQRQLDHVQSTAPASHGIRSTAVKMPDSTGAILMQDWLQKYDAAKRRRIVDAPVGLPADLQILGDSLTRPTVPHRLGRSWEEQEFPADRDFLYGVPFTR